MISKLRRKEKSVDDGADRGHSSARRQSSIVSGSSGSATLAHISSGTSSGLSDASVEQQRPLGLTLLHSPLEPRIDFIFIHGLGGSSQKTWSKSGSAAGRSVFWPQDWLPEDATFHDVRIHTFGYEANFLKDSGDFLNIHDLGKSLLNAVSTSPWILHSSTMIVFIGHSMGGLVMKKAFILAMQDARHSQLADRIKAMYFLATPHRGAGGAKTLKNILRIAHDRAYVADMTECSGAIQVINDEFRHFSKRLQLCSLYETRFMKHFNSLIVDPQSAVLGYPDENQIPMAADHRTICKFETPNDPNYVLLRNALAHTVENILTNEVEPPRRQNSDQLKELRKQLGVPGILDDDLLLASQSRMDGSCHWLLERPAFQNWKNGQDESSRMLWIKGKPATGKSVLAGFAVDHLCNSGMGCSYFFFKHGDKSKSRFARCLRSLAFQMASLSPDAVGFLLELSSNGVRLDQIDEQILWRRLLESGIFGDVINRHFWVIDGLDECSNIAIFLDEILPHSSSIGSLRILFISRDTASLEHSFVRLGKMRVKILEVAPLDTRSDLKTLVEVKSRELGILDPDSRASLTEKILRKSKGSFLWTLLVLKELSNCNTSREIDATLEEVPKGMEPLYQRILDSMSASTSKKPFAKAILSWAACAVRPMLIEELKDALSLEFQDSVLSLEKSITSLCGELVTVDKFGKVQMIHETAREFLLSPECDSEFYVDRVGTHTRLAQTCLQYLTGDEMRPPRPFRRRSAAKVTPKRMQFAKYAIFAFSYHVYKSEYESTDTLQLLQRFLSSNVASWIEALAEGGLLNQLLRASSHIGYFGNLRAMEVSPMHPCIRQISQWVIDLPRISAMFSTALETLPSSIYAQVPAFCPTESMIHKLNMRGRKISVIGASRAQWEDRISYIEFRNGQPSSLRYGDDFLAVGLTTGSVILYRHKSYQAYKTLKHGESVRHLAFKSGGQFFASAGMKTVKVWDIGNGTVIHSFDHQPRPLAMEFGAKNLIIASHRNILTSWTLSKERQPETVERPWSVGPTEGSETLQQPPTALSVSLSHGILAVAYSGREIILWDMEEGEYVGSCGKKNIDGTTSTHVVVALVLNPIADMALMAVAYLDGDLALIDPFADTQVCCFRANCQSLASCPNGRLLAVGCANGTIDVYEFDTLKLLYRVQSSNYFIKQIGFSKDSLSFADIRGSQCSIWEPDCFLRDSLNDDSSCTSTSAVVQTVATEAKAKITTMELHPSNEFLFCGRDDGSVALYDRRSAAQLQQIHNHKSSIRATAWCAQRGALLSVDVSNKLLLTHFGGLPLRNWKQEPETLFQTRLEVEEAVVDIVISDDAGRFIASTREYASLFDLRQGNHLTKIGLAGLEDVCKWVPSPLCTSRVACISSSKVQVYRWSDLAEIRHVELSMEVGKSLRNAMLISTPSAPRIMLEFVADDQGTAVGGSKVAVFDPRLLGLDDDSSEATPEAAISSLSELSLDESRVAPESQTTQSIAHAIGFTESGRLVFLDQASWVRSVDLKPLEDVSRTDKKWPAEPLEAMRHFFVPRDWFAGRKDMLGAVAQGDVMLTRGGELAIVKGGMDGAEGAISK